MVIGADDTIERRRWLPERALVLVVDGGFAVVSLALSCININTVMVSRLRWDAALYHKPDPQPEGKRGAYPLLHHQRPPRQAEG